MRLIKDSALGVTWYHTRSRACITWLDVYRDIDRTPKFRLSISFYMIIELVDSRLYFLLFVCNSLCE